MALIKPQEIPKEKHRLIVDVRTPDEFLIEHIPDSKNIPIDELSKEVNKIKEQEEVILTCRSGNRAQRAKELLESLGCKNIKVIEGGLNMWKSCSLPVESFKKGLSIMQQVQIIAGSMVLVGTLFKPLWFLALMAGCGLLLAGSTNICLMEKLLNKLPWNKINSNENRSCSLK